MVVAVDELELLVDKHKYFVPLMVVVLEMDSNLVEPIMMMIDDLIEPVLVLVVIDNLVEVAPLLVLVDKLVESA